ncbi:MAG: hypothetical protein MJY50_03265 [Bacteroidales bacterium]|nr:hypothetical protein [Bacteroidales bacterium]
MKTVLHTVTLLVILVLLNGSCSSSRKISSIREGGMRAGLSLPDDVKRTMQLDTTFTCVEDTITVTIDGREMILMHAVLDDESGEMVAAQELRPAVVSARFRNIAERHGKIDLRFQITVPKEMQDSRWQLRFDPDMIVMGDTVSLDRVMITGSDYRKSQLRGYQQYRKFLSGIVSDTTSFVDIRNLEIFLQRHIPRAYAFRNDTSFVSDEVFESCFGVSDIMAIDHYTDKLAKRRNELKISRKDRMRRRFVKSPIVTEHIRLDTVISGSGEELIYDYVQTIKTGKDLRKVGIVLSGEIYESDRRLYLIPPADPLTFYISSLSTLVDRRDRYLTRVIERKAEANAAWYVDFRKGSAVIDESLSTNARQMDNIRHNLRRLILNDTFDLDSITITSFASPEGARSHNDRLSENRARSVSGYFGDFVAGLRDSIAAESGFSISLSEDKGETVDTDPTPQIRFISNSGGENWFLLDHLVDTDTLLSEDQKARYKEISDGIEDLDKREKALSGENFYPRLRDDFYPLLRTVQFNFYLHRKGMVKDTVHTTVPDTVYMKGVQALTDREYEKALDLLMPYQDYNTAVAFVSLDRNLSALHILEGLKRTAAVNYLLAILYARCGDVRQAVQCYLTSCSQEPSYVHRGNLDPEISELIRNYGLNQQ